MNKNKMISAVAGFMFVAGIGFAAQAAPPVGACPNGEPWELVRINKAIDRDAAKQADGNGDRHVCENDQGQLQYQDNEK